MRPKSITDGYDNLEAAPTSDTSTRPDIGVLAARSALQAVLGKRLKAYDTGPQVILISVPSREWVQPVSEAWRVFAKAGRKHTRNSHHRPKATERDWFLVQQDSRGAIDEDDVQVGLAEGFQVFIVAYNGDAVTPLSTAMADLAVTISSLPWAELKAVAKASAGQTEHAVGFVQQAWPEAPREDVIARINPVILRLSQRRKEGPQKLLTRAAALASAGMKFKVGSTKRTAGFARVPGIGKALEWGRALAKDIAAYKAGHITWSDVDRGVLLSGPPGCGKTTFATALAEEVGIPLILGSHSQWQAAGHQGDMLKAMRLTFSQARAAAPCILFIDEIDGFPDREKVGSDRNCSRGRP